MPAVSHANNSFSYVSAGYQLSNVTAGFYDYLAEENSSGEFESPGMGGGYLNGALDIYNRVFVTVDMAAAKELDPFFLFTPIFKTRTTKSYEEYYVGLGYHMPLLSSVEGFASVGRGQYTGSEKLQTYENNAWGTSTTTKHNHIGISSEVGLRYTPWSWLTMQPSYRYSPTRIGGLHKFKITNLISFSDNFGVELNAAESRWKNLNQTDYQVGIRYSFS